MKYYEIETIETSPDHCLLVTDESRPAELDGGRAVGRGDSHAGGGLDPTADLASGTHLTPIDAATDPDTETVVDTRAASDAETAAGIYRVVGTPPGEVTLLRVGDADDLRVYTGEVTRVSRDRLPLFVETRAPETPGIVESIRRTVLWALGLR